MSSACLIDTKESVGSLSSDGKLYSLKVFFTIASLPVGTNGGRGSNTQKGPQPPFSGGELVGLQCPKWKTSEEAILGVVQSWDPVYDMHSSKTSAKGGLFIRVLVCASATGGDGDGGRGGWVPLANIQECLGNRKEVGSVIPVTLVGAGSLMTSSREFQAIMSISDFPERVRRCLVDPAVSKEGKTPRKSSVGTLARRALCSGGGEGWAEDSGLGAQAAGGGNDSPPPNVPAKLWQGVVASYNVSQVQAIRKVAEGSAAGFTLLQVRRSRDVAVLEEIMFRCMRRG